MAAIKGSNISGLEILVPPSFAGILPVSPSRRRFVYERETIDGLRRTLRPHVTVFDVGCSYGVTTVMIALLTERTGAVHAFDGNADVLERARELARANGIDNVRWNTTLVGDAVKEAIPFFAVPDFRSPASTLNRDITHWHQDAELRQVPMVSLDDYCERHGGRPDCIKIDVEGAEFAVLQGGERVLRQARPSLVIETHGLEIVGILGSLQALTGVLARAAYAFVDLRTGEPVSGSTFAALYAEKIGHLLAVPE